MSEITKILIANRGEIALRIIRTARAMGIATVAVYSDADRDAAHVIAADEAVRIGAGAADSSAPAASYLNIDALLRAAKETGADAVHPGYGFLSERAEFARRCGEAGLVFIGPPPEVIEAMGRKDYARRVAEQAAVPVLPTYRPDDPAMRLPVLVKAAAGGGGKGMRIVRYAADLPEALAAAQREAESAFGDGTMLIERYVEHGRHVEVQVLADAHGNVLHLGERDCSVQRRHQKVVEESPAPTISAAARESLLDAAVRLAAQVGYVNAGTVEFLVTGDEFFLLEMNTRLQVEHPVTELVTGLDLVELQIRVAAGEPLPLRQEQVSSHGHAIEVRVYAEDADHGFLPQAGRAGVVAWPRGEGVRVDAALRSFDEVSAWYDPMIGKVTGYGRDRECARETVLAALTRTRIDGLTTNLGFLSALLGSAQFAEAAIDTAWLDRNPDLPLHPRLGADGPTPFDLLDGWRLAGPPRPAQARVERSRASSSSAAAVLDGVVRAPMPGTVIALKAGPGQRVSAGEALGALEAMKMEHTLTAPHDGVVTRVGACVGDQVPIGAELFVVESPAGEEPAGEAAEGEDLP
ncbi:ATP-grasp domain-containing protein [Actinocrinis puniceicyclus]|uniref:ATP-grasp domain-containing protein n=1 Tax=Actinocrinis puniceicyclus TaxID=977794 RepID=A0A8J7WLS3_9ACTN|nr:biotin carboxylase N-terminal domain-containing protein [Actinocrinis puniceicyclus]MBS2963618.1 ATP-grasp domain-containing protein [Actinocrinis puniceicyclus]